jgi:hypothetical protein
MTRTAASVLFLPLTRRHHLVVSLLATAAVVSIVFAGVMSVLSVHA